MDALGSTLEPPPPFSGLKALLQTDLQIKRSYQSGRESQIGGIPPPRFVPKAPSTCSSSLSPGLIPLNTWGRVGEEEGGGSLDAHLCVGLLV